MRRDTPNRDMRHIPLRVAWGLYNMQGNVCEWHRDWYHAARRVESIRI